MRTTSLFALILFANFSLADATIKLPDKVSGDIGDFIKVPATTTGSQVRWVAMDKGLCVFPVELLKDSKTAVVIAKMAGSYRLLAYTASADVPSDPAVCTVVVGDPVPPAPPVPPTPPAPVDAFTQAVQAAFSAETDVSKTAQAVQLAALYRVASTSTVNDASLTTTADLLSRLQAARKAILPDAALTKVRAAIQAELNKTLTTSTNLDSTTRVTVGALFATVATVLEGLK